MKYAAIAILLIAAVLIAGSKLSNSPARVQARIARLSAAIEKNAREVDLCTTNEDCIVISENPADSCMINRHWVLSRQNPKLEKVRADIRAMMAAQHALSSGHGRGTSRDCAMPSPPPTVSCEGGHCMPRVGEVR